ncbi:MAG: LapA family protein [Proteobacteria bacterium]|nr:LapA family protein [Pseudomonadota bacterium]
MRILAWLVRGLVFFLLFAFALNNQHLITVHGFWGHAWQGPLVVALLVAFGGGIALGIAAMAPHWWRRGRSQPQPAQADAALAGPPTAARPPVVDGVPDAY